MARGQNSTTADEIAPLVLWWAAFALADVEAADGSRASVGGIPGTHTAAAGDKSCPFVAWARTSLHSAETDPCSGVH